MKEIASDSRLFCPSMHFSLDQIQQPGYIVPVSVPSRRTPVNPLLRHMEKAHKLTLQPMAMLFTKRVKCHHPHFCRGKSRPDKKSNVVAGYRLDQ